MSGIPLIKVIFLGGGTVATVSALPGIISNSLVDSGVNRTIKAGQAENSLFNGNLKYENGKWNFKNVCFYYKGEPGGNQMNIVCYATGWGIGSGCHTLRSHVDKKLPTVEFSVDLTPLNSVRRPNNERIYVALYMREEGATEGDGQLLGCVEVTWWKNSGGSRWNKQEVIVGDLFRVDGQSGCVTSTFKSKGSSKNCNKSTPCKKAWEAVEDKKTKKWDDVWTNGVSKIQAGSGGKYEKLWTDNTTWKLEQK